MSNLVFDGIFQLRRAFVEAGLEPPVTLDLKSRADGQALLSMLVGNGKNSLRSLTLSAADPWAKPVRGADGKPWLELNITIFDMKIRLPAI